MPAVIPCYDMAGNAVRNPRAIASGVDAIVARLRARWWTIRGEWPEDVSFGLPWEEWVMARSLTPSEVAAEVRGQAEQVTGVVQVLTVTAIRTGRTISCDVRMRVDTGDGTLLDITVPVTDPYQTVGGPGWWVTTGAIGGASR